MLKSKVLMFVFKSAYLSLAAPQFVFVLLILSLVHLLLLRCYSSSTVLCICFTHSFPSCSCCCCSNNAFLRSSFLFEILLQATCCSASVILSQFAICRVEPSAFIMTGPMSSNLMLSPSLILGIDGSFDDSGNCKTSLLSSLLFIVDDADSGLVDMAETVMRFLLLTNALLSLEKIKIAWRNTANDVAVMVR